MPILIQEWLLPWAMYAVSIFNLVLLFVARPDDSAQRAGAQLGHLSGRQRFSGRRDFLFIAHGGAQLFARHALGKLADLVADSVGTGRRFAVWLDGFDAVVLRLLGRISVRRYGAARAGFSRWRRRLWSANSPWCGSVCRALAFPPFTYAEPSNITQFVSLRLLLWLYPLFLLCCTGTALLALLRPMPAASWSREASQKRARPFLLGSSIVQLSVSCAVAGALVYFALAGNRADLYNPAGSQTALYNVAGALAQWLNATDFALCLGISLAVMLLGKAVVSFEIFTGKVLPRRGFWRQWRAVVLLAAIYSLLIATSLGFDIEGIYPLLLSTCLLGIILALFRIAPTPTGRARRRIWPFVASGHLLQGLLQGDEARLQSAIDEPFRALCEDVLNAGRAMLVARGDIAPLFGAPRFYPAAMPAVALWAELAARHSHSSEVQSLPEGCGMDYLVPLGQSGNIGALLLGPRRRRRVIHARRNRNRARGGRTLVGFGRRSNVGRTFGGAATPESRARRHARPGRAPLFARRYFAFASCRATLSRRSRRKNYRRAPGHFGFAARTARAAPA